MTDAYRDDLEAALTRASDLEREVEDLRRRNAELESTGDTDEARENARRLAVALERERAEEKVRDDRTRDEALLRQAAHDAARAEKKTNPAVVMACLVPSCFAGAVAAMGGGKGPHHNEPHPEVAAILAVVGVLCLFGAVGYVWIKRRRKAE